MKRFFSETLLELLSRFPEGATLEELLVGLQDVPRRTLQRRLEIFVREGRVIAIGKTRSRKFKLSETSGVAPKPLEVLIPLTPESEMIQASISLPIQIRPSVGYCKEFLENYQPNRDSYLSAAEKRELAILGSSNDGKYPAGTYARQIFDRLLIDLSWNSSRLEGNTYSLLETRYLLEQGQAAEGKDLRDTQMILNHKAAIEFLIYSAQEIGINRYTILNLHTLLSDNLLSAPSAGGRLRSIPVGIHKSTYLPLAIPQVIEECFNLLLDKARRIEDPFEQAFFLMVHLPYLQPFDDVNKRTSRLAANIPLIQKNLCPLSFAGVPEEAYINGLLGVYEQNRVGLLRDVFIEAYKQSCALYSTVRQTMGEPDPFRFQYRQALYQLVAEIVRSRKDPVQAIREIREWSQAHISQTDQARFIELVERELSSLHEGNLARYRLGPSEYQDWQEIWSPPKI